MELINFIMKGDKLTSSPVLTEFVEKYPLQNGGILGEDVLKFTQLFGTNVSLILDNNYRITTKGVLMYVVGGTHMFYLYNNDEEHVLEKWDPSTWQKTTNNCTLYTGIIAVVRPHLTFEQTAQLIGRIIDTKDSETAKRLATISKHFFARDISWFRYKFDISNIIAPSIVKQIEKKHIGQCLIMIRDMPSEDVSLYNLTKDKKQKLITDISSRSNSIYVITDDSTVFGFMNMYKQSSYNYINFIYVDKPHRNNDYMSRMIKYVISKNEPIRIHINSELYSMKRLLETLNFTCIEESSTSELYEYKP